jgi:hypothetical protein
VGIEGRGYSVLLYQIFECEGGFQEGKVPEALAF